MNDKYAWCPMLAEAIIARAAQDYLYAKSDILSKKTLSTEAMWDRQRIVREVQSFFLSEWYSALSDVDGKWLLSVLDEKAKTVKRPKMAYKDNVGLFSKY